MHKALLDTSTYLDIRRAGRHRSSSWAQNTLRHLIAYRSEHSVLTISGLTVFEILEGLYREPRLQGTAQEFLTSVLPGFEVIYPHGDIVDLGAQINAKLAGLRQSIGVVDALIAATAIHHGLSLVNANPKHFLRVREAGFPLDIHNWRAE